MDLFYTAEWMKKQEQQRKQQPLIELRMTPGDKTHNEYILTMEGRVIERFDLKERGPGEIFMASVTHGEHVFDQETDPEETNQVCFRNQNGIMLEAECRGWLGNSFIIKHK